MSSQGTLENVRTAVAPGAKGFVVKPYTRDKVADMLKHLKA